MRIFIVISDPPSPRLLLLWMRGIRSVYLLSKLSLVGAPDILHAEFDCSYECVTDFAVSVHS